LSSIYVYKQITQRSVGAVSSIIIKQVTNLSCVSSNDAKQWSRSNLCLFYCR